MPTPFCSMPQTRGVFIVSRASDSISLSTLSALQIVFIVHIVLKYRGA